MIYTYTHIYLYIQTYFYVTQYFKRRFRNKFLKFVVQNGCCKFYRFLRYLRIDNHQLNRYFYHQLVISYIHIQYNSNWWSLVYKLHFKCNCASCVKSNNSCSINGHFPNQLRLLKFTYCLNPTEESLLILIYFNNIDFL